MYLHVADIIVVFVLSFLASPPCLGIPPRHSASVTNGTCVPSLYLTASVGLAEIFWHFFWLTIKTKIPDTSSTAQNREGSLLLSSRIGACQLRKG